MLLIGIAGGAWAPAAGAGAAVPDAAATAQVGVYDSRAVAYAHFWSASARKERDAAVAAARAAQAAGDTADFQKRSETLAAHQKRMHEQVFSTAPAEEAMAALAPRVPALVAELGVTRFVSKWDGKALKSVPASNRIDVTDRLVREFITPDDRQRKVLESMKAKPPLSLWQIKLLNLFGAA